MIVFSPDQSHLYLPNIRSHNVTVIDTLSDKIVKPGSEGLAMHKDGTLYVANQEDNILYIIHLKTFEILHKRMLGETPVHLVFSPDYKYALIPNRCSKDVSVIDTAQPVNGLIRPWEIKCISVGNQPGGIV